MTTVSCTRCALRGKTKVGYRTTFSASCAFSSPAAFTTPGGEPVVREEVDLCSACRSDAAMENSKALSRRKGRGPKPPGFTS